MSVQLVPLQLALFALPTLAYVAVQRRRLGSWPAALAKVGIRGTGVRWYAVGVLLGVLGVVGILQTLLLRDLADEPGLSFSQYGGWQLKPETLALVFLHQAFYTTLGEELFFRGMLGTWLVDRLGFGVGNLVQAACFLLPHLLILLVSLRLWPFVLSSFGMGLILGWLRHRSGSIAPGWVAHTLANTIAIAATLARV